MRIDLNDSDDRRMVLVWVMGICIVGVVWSLVYLAWSSTGPTDGESSGMGLRVDSLTGCHYLVVPFAGITPRLDAEGSQVCTGAEHSP